MKSQGTFVSGQQQPTKGVIESGGVRILNYSSELLKCFSNCRPFRDTELNRLFYDSYLKPFLNVIPTSKNFTMPVDGILLSEDAIGDCVSCSGLPDPYNSVVLQVPIKKKFGGLINKLIIMKDGNDIFLAASDIKTDTWKPSLMQIRIKRNSDDGIIKFEACKLGAQFIGLSESRVIIIKDFLNIICREVENIYMQFVIAMNSMNTIVIDNGETPLLSVNEKRMRKGKNPIIGSSVIRIKIGDKIVHPRSRGYKIQNQQPKCTHERRGHVRYYKTGKQAQVRSSVVNPDGKISIIPRRYLLIAESRVKRCGLKKIAEVMTTKKIFIIFRSAAHSSLMYESAIT